MAKKLHYFDVNGLGEPIRYILHYAGEKFEDIRHSYADWPNNDFKNSLPLGKMPYYQEGDRALHQSIAIARYIASKTGLLPVDPWEQALLDATVLSIYDFWSRLLVYIFEKDPVKKQELKKTLLSETVELFFSRFEEDLKANGGHFGGKLTWADFMLTGILECANMYLGDEIEKNYPTVKKLVEKVRSLPGVKQYIETRTPYIAKTEFHDEK